MNSPQSTQLALFTLEKRCLKCGAVKPLDAFNVCTRVLDGRKSRCKECTAQENVEYRAKHRVVRPPRTEKPCSRCKVVKPLDAFRARQSYCLDCERDYKHEWHLAHADIMRARALRWVKDNRARARTAQAAWQAANIETVRAYRRAHYWRNRDAILAQARKDGPRRRPAIRMYAHAWRKANPAKTRMYWQNRRARVLAAGGAFTDTDITEIYIRQDSRCLYCLCPLGTSFNVEHRIPLSRGGSNDPSNLDVTCKRCNSRKGTLTDTEYRERLRREAAVSRRRHQVPGTPRPTSA